MRGPGACLVVGVSLTLTACQQPATNNIAEARTAVGSNASAGELEREKVVMILTHLTDSEPWDQLSIEVDSGGSVSTERRRYFASRPINAPTREEVVRRDTTQLSRERASDFRLALSTLRPQLARDPTDIIFNALPGCPVPLHSFGIISIRFEAPDGRVGGFSLDSGCRHSDAARARAIVAQARAVLPPSRAAEGFTY